ncbi:hypothetical protein MVEN_00453600 [Mycena venus]|uniref:Uncharacterized protein n=1 Tax=Mycena venus TaxID=2733690 RepID=A0A8H6YWW3_9AGAR|nr:hypothetical protein MVEN_00453600 [Mycena venus]
MASSLRSHSPPRRSRSQTRHDSSSPPRRRRSGSPPRHDSSSPPRRRRSRSPSHHGSSHRSSSVRGRDSDNDGHRESNIDYKAAFLALQASNELAAQKKRKRGADPSIQSKGRPIRMLVALFGEISTIVTEAESYLKRRRYPEDDFDQFSVGLTPEQDEYLADKRKCERNPMLLDDDLVPFYVQLQKGANDSRSDDFGRVTVAFAGWYNAERDRPDIIVFDHTPPIIDKDGNTVRQYAPVLFEDRVNRGPDHEVCGGLLTCLEHDWRNADVRASLRDNTTPFNESFWCRIFYLNFQGDLDNVNDGFLQSRYLVKTYKIVFTGPASAKDMEDENSAPKKRKTSAPPRRPIRKPPCEIFHMNGKVTPRSLAYICVLLHGALTNVDRWTNEVYGFPYPQMYNFIVDYFEGPREGTPQREHADRLLAWWNQQIFPAHASSASTSRTVVNSMVKLREQAQRAELEG